MKKKTVAKKSLSNKIEVFFAPHEKDVEKFKVITWIKMDDDKMCLCGPKLIFENEDDMREFVAEKVIEYGIPDPIISFTQEKPGLVTTVNGISPF